MNDSKEKKFELLKEQIELLNKPLPAEAVSPHPTKPYLSTIKAIYVIERFNEVFGVHGWTLEDEIIEKIGEMIVVKATFEAREYGIIRKAYGGNNNSDRGDAYKGAVTDAVTKIGSYLGIGMDVFKGLANEQKREEKLVTEQKMSEWDAGKKVGEVCKDCGQGVYVISKAGRTYCDNKCWLSKKEGVSRVVKQDDNKLFDDTRPGPAADEEIPF